MFTFFMLVLALSLDTFIVSLTYGAENIKISFISNFIISFICSLALFISLFLGKSLSLIIPVYFLKFISFCILFFIGIIKIFDVQIKDYLGRFKNINFVNIYTDYKKADKDNSNVLSYMEAFVLALALSIDSLSAGIAFNVDFGYIILIFLGSLFINICFITVSRICGKYISKINFNFSLLSGFIFIILAFFRI